MYSELREKNTPHRPAEDLTVRKAVRLAIKQVAYIALLGLMICGIHSLTLRHSHARAHTSSPAITHNGSATASFKGKTHIPSAASSHGKVVQH